MAAIEIPDVLTWDETDLTIDEVELVEETLGVPLDDIDDPTKVRRGKALRVMAWILMRRIDSAATLADVGKVRVAQLDRATGPTAPGA